MSLQGTPREIELWKIFVVQMHRAKEKGCQLFTVKMEKLEECKEFISQDDVYYGPRDPQDVEEGEVVKFRETDMEKYPILQKFVDVFP